MRRPIRAQLPDGSVVGVTRKGGVGAAKVNQAVRVLTKMDVLVGIPGSRRARSGGGIGNAALLYIHENGAPDAGIPARPSVGPGIKRAGPAIAKVLKAGAAAAQEGRVDGVRKSLHAAGLVAVSSIKNTIRDGVPPPLAKSTLAARRRKGRTGTTPLLDSAQMMNAITHVVREK